MKSLVNIHTGPRWMQAGVECDIRYIDGPEVYGLTYNKCWTNEEERDFVEAFMKGIEETFAKFGLGNIYKVEIFNIKIHDVDSNCTAFKIAGIEVAKKFLGQPPGRTSSNHSKIMLL